MLAITQYSVEQYYDNTMVSVCFSTVETWMKSMYFILSIAVFFFLPLVVLVILYALIAKTLMGHPNLMAPYKNSAAQTQSVIKYRKQLVIMLGTVVLAFFICLLPFRAFTLWIIVVPAENILKIGLERYYNLLYFCRIMFHINSAINPILYNIMSSKFRGGFLRVCGLGHVFTGAGYKGKTDINRKNTFNTTSSTNNSTQHTSESFLSRHGKNNNSKNSERGVKDVSDQEVYVRAPRSGHRLISGESFV
ncbi:PREDICTED: thyrotropin-releasing hormone receptor-like isoform X2 [Nicrophorus vespilloides]|nr:PREDICTED: thyrotropin-releasing hormone receptor-like isoform X2 [Nicrophorus vespilloides]